MSRYVAFLRGMNIGRRRIKNDELCLAFEGMGFLDVSAFLASGNVIFYASGTGTSHIAGTDGSELIEPALEASLGYKVPTFLRNSDEVKAIAAHHPFDNVKGDFSGKGDPAAVPGPLRRNSGWVVCRESRGSGTRGSPQAIQRS